MASISSFRAMLLAPSILMSMAGNVTFLIAILFSCCKRYFAGGVLSRSCYISYSARPKWIWERHRVQLWSARLMCFSIDILFECCYLAAGDPVVVQMKSHCVQITFHLLDDHN